MMDKIESEEAPAASEQPQESAPAVAQRTNSKRGKRPSWTERNRHLLHGNGPQDNHPLGDPDDRVPADDRSEGARQDDRASSPASTLISSTPLMKSDPPRSERDTWGTEPERQETLNDLVARTKYAVEVVDFQMKDEGDKLEAEVAALNRPLYVPMLQIIERFDTPDGFDDDGFLAWKKVMKAHHRGAKNIFQGVARALKSVVTSPSMVNKRGMVLAGLRERGVRSDTVLEEFERVEAFEGEPKSGQERFIAIFKAAQKQQSKKDDAEKQDEDETDAEKDPQVLDAPAEDERREELVRTCIADGRFIVEIFGERHEVTCFERDGTKFVLVAT
jgi:hypothetical protein